MKKRLMFALMMVLCVLLLCSCGEETTKFNVLGTGDSGNAGQQNTDDLYEGMDPLAEEDTWTDPEDYQEITITQPPVVTNTPAPTMRSEYAGATPVVIDPIDKPTPTPVPKLAVTYTTYDATKLGLSFEGPAGWLKDDSAKDTFTIQNPNANMDYPATLTLRAEKVDAAYTTNNLKTVVQNYLNSIGDANFPDEYNPSRTDTRELLGKTGVYANYDGVMADGTRVAGRIHAVYVDKVVYVVHLSAPYAQWEDYKDMVYDHLRDTIKITK